MNTLISKSPIIQTEIDCLSFIINYAVEQQFSVALWKLPDSPSRHLVLSYQPQRLKKDGIIEDLKTGFIFSPFDRKKDSLYLEADLSFTFHDGVLTPPETPLENKSAEWLNTIFTSSTQAKSKTNFYSQPNIEEQDDKAAYIKQVIKSIEAIEQGSLEKIVLSRTHSIELAEGMDVVKVFESLCVSHPTALVSLVSTPDTGTWLGASPEMLVGLYDNTIFKTVALAGTKPYQDGTNLKTVAWTQKEIEEQALVERYIISCFKKIRLREYNEHGPKTVIAGNVLHLKSDFEVDMKATNFPQLGSTMLQLLHPTSAVCGMPLEPALNFLEEHEGYDRQFYAGYLGPVNFKNATNLFVNLRCMQLQQKRAVLYAGAGITIDSDAEDEWNETEIKMRTMLKVIQQQ